MAPRPWFGPIWSREGMIVEPNGARLNRVETEVFEHRIVRTVDGYLRRTSVQLSEDAAAK
jgi:hypothetical protein